MTTYMDALSADSKAAVEVESGQLNSVLDATVIALIVAGFVTLGFNVLARL